MLDTVLSFVCDLGRGIERTAIRPALLTGDNQAHTFRIAVSRSGQAVSLSGAGVSGYFIRADGVTVPITGSVDGSAALVTLSDGCYRVPGRFQLVVKVAQGGDISTVFWCDGAVASSSTDAILDDEDVIPSLDELLAKIAATEAAAASATSAAATASSAASTADTAASRANTAAASVEGMSAKATTLSPGSQATASMATVDGAKVLTIGVPQGGKGDKGDPGDVSSVNGVAPVQGNVTLTASDVGALEADGTADNAAMLGGKAPEYYLQPRNLLDNSDFRIAQAGYGGLHGTQKYACDRWYDTYGFGSFSFNESEGLTIAYATNHAYLVQKINGASLLHGKTVTLAMQLSDGSVYAKSGVFVSDGASFIIDIATDKTLTLFSDRVEFVVTSGSMTIKWAALYEGSYTADTLPPYVPKGYAAELAECQRYFWRCNNTWFAEGAGYAFSDTEFYVSIVLPQIMRVTPTMVSSTGDTTFYGIKIQTGGRAKLTPTAVTFSMKNNRIALTLTGTFTNGELGVLRLENDYLDFSADL